VENLSSIWEKDNGPGFGWFSVNGLERQKIFKPIKYCNINKININ
jgi:hypothetical protein